MTDDALRQVAGPARVTPRPYEARPDGTVRVIDGTTQRFEVQLADADLRQLQLALQQLHQGGIALPYSRQRRPIDGLEVWGVDHLGRPTTVLLVDDELVLHGGGFSPVSIRGASSVTDELWRKIISAGWTG